LFAPYGYTHEYEKNPYISEKRPAKETYRRGWFLREQAAPTDYEI